MGSGDQRATEGEIRGMFRNQSFGNKTEETIRDTRPFQRDNNREIRIGV